MANLFDLAERFRLPDIRLGGVLPEGGVSQVLFGEKNYTPTYSSQPGGMEFNTSQTNPNTLRNLFLGPDAQAYGSMQGPQTAGLRITSASPGGPSGSAAFNVRGQRATAPVGPDPRQQEQNYLNSIKSTQEAARQASASGLKNLKGGIQNSYQGVFQNLDAQLEGLPGLQQSAQSDIELGAQGQRAGIQAGRERSLQSLGQAEEGVRTQTKGNLRTLAEDVRNQLKAAGQYIGGLGAGDSSAAGIAAGAVGKYGLKERGKQLEQEQQLVQQISNQRLQVEQIANEELSRVEQQKQLQMSQIAREFQGIMQDLNNRKANASFQEAQQITEAEQQIAQELQDRLSGLDSEVRQYQSNVVTWNMQRQAELEDYATKQAIAGTFRGQVDPYQKAGNIYKGLMATGAYSPEQAAQLVKQQTGIYISPQEEINYNDLLKQKEYESLYGPATGSSSYIAPQQQQLAPATSGFLGL